MTLSLQIIIASAATSLFIAGCEKKSVPSDPVDTTVKNPAQADAPRSTAVSKADPADSTAKTPTDQSESSVDLKITASIRRAIIDDKSMSMNAQNCKIITEKSGVVTLRGVVDSQAEKDAIESKAKAVAGVSRVDNQLEIKAG